MLIVIIKKIGRLNVAFESPSSIKWLESSHQTMEKISKALAEITYAICSLAPTIP